MLCVHGKCEAVALPGRMTMQRHFQNMIFPFLNDSVFVCTQFAEIVGGYIAGSLAIMSDAAHLLSDCISFIVALMAICLSKKSPDNYMTFGYKRVGKCVSHAGE